MTKIKIDDQYEINPTVRATLCGVTVLLALATLITAGSSLGAKISFVLGISSCATICFSILPSLPVWRRK